MGAVAERLARQEIETEVKKAPPFPLSTPERRQTEKLRGER